MDSEEFRRRGREVIEFLIDYLKTISDRNIMHSKKRGYLKKLIPASAPQQPQSFDQIMQDIKNCILSGIVHWRHPRYFAYFPCGGSFPSILADMLVSTINCAGFSWAVGPACTELEMITLDWLGKMIGLPESFLSLSSSGHLRGGGVIQVSTTDSLLITMIAARFTKAKEINQSNPDLDKREHIPFFVAYCSTISHSSIAKVAEVAMVQVRLLETDKKRRLRGETLAKAMKEDRESGLIPFFVYASLGTTACCSCDAVNEIGPLCKLFGVWLHVDGAYAGSALICPEFRYYLRGIEYAESFSIDLSIWMLMNFDCCALWVQNREKFTEALIIDPLYLQHAFSGHVIDYRQWGIPLSRRFRSLKLWFVIRSYGVEGLQKHIRHHVYLAKLFQQFIWSDNRFIIENDVEFGLVCFRIKGCNDLNKQILSSINETGLIFLVGTMLEDKFVIRFCVCSEKSTVEDVEFAWKIIAEITENVIAEHMKLEIDCCQKDN